jgi:uncharacterized Fe-S cluster protein YjdI
MSDDLSQPQSPVEAGEPSTTGPTRVYENDEIRVFWDATRCLHVGKCLQALPEVFDSLRRPWIEIDAAAPDAVAKTVLICPTGALRYESKGGLPAESPPTETEVEVRPNGPLYVRGAVRVIQRGEVVTEEYRVALCRCGGSRNKPFCDNSHRRLGFRG